MRTPKPLSPPKATTHTNPTAYGGSLLRTRRGRRRGRPLSTRCTMHFVLRSSLARGELSFRRPANLRRIRALLERFARRRNIRILHAAFPGNHIHLHLKLERREGYKPFIRALTAAIALAIGGTTRWNPVRKRFWDYRPFSRVVKPGKDFATVAEYVEINRLEQQGLLRHQARYQVELRRTRRLSRSAPS